MGIPGLTTYINGNPKFMENYELHDNRLVIDGLALATRLYLSAGCNSSFAGDLDKFSHRLSTFFDELHMCKVTPVVILDGYKNEKIDAAATRKFTQMQVIAKYTPAFEAHAKIDSMALSVVFEAVLRQKGVKTLRCFVNENENIAAVAKSLYCSVLSDNSDFYIYDVKYIPIDSLAPIVQKGWWHRRYVIPCQLFRQTYIWRSFPSLSLEMLPLTAILLGNDYVTPDTFERFFIGMQLSSRSRRLCSTEQRKIDTVFIWLQDQYGLDHATAGILSKMPKSHRKELLSIIEFEVNRYRVLSFEILPLSGLAEDCRTPDQLEEFHFSRDVETLDARSFWSEEQLVASEDSCSKEETCEASPIPESDCAGELFYAQDAMKFWSEQRLAASDDSCLKDERGETKPVLELDGTFADVTLPMCFGKHYVTADLPAYFLDLMASASFDVPVQMENFDYPSAHSMCMKIVGVIHGLLVAGYPDKCARGLSYMIRNGSHLVVRHMDTVKGTRTMTFPALWDLDETPRLVRKQIFDDTMEISGLDVFMDDVPVEWRLYVIAIAYWWRQTDEPSRNSGHLNAVLFAMLSGVVDRKIGFHGSMKLFHEHYAETLAELKAKRQGEKPVETDVNCDSIVKALKSVRHGDCLLAAPIFIKLRAIDEELCENPQNFNVTIVHVFAQLLSCIKEALHLNALLRYPYKPLNIGDFFNGTMLYNLYTGFEKVSDVKAYKYEMLKESPSIGCLLTVMNANIRNIIATAHAN